MSAGSTPKPTIRERLTQNAEQFDAIVSELLTEHERLLALSHSQPQTEPVAVMFNSYGEIRFDTDLSNFEHLPHPQYVYETNPKDWHIDTSTETEILMHKDCSVIEGEQARYLLWLINKPQVQNVPMTLKQLRLALNNMMEAYQRLVRSKCSTEELEKEPWRCMEYVAAEEAINQSKLKLHFTDEWLKENIAAEGENDILAGRDIAALSQPQPQRD